MWRCVLFLFMSNCLVIGIYGSSIYFIAFLDDSSVVSASAKRLRLPALRPPASVYAQHVRPASRTLDGAGTNFRASQSQRFELSDLVGH